MNKNNLIKLFIFIVSAVLLASMFVSFSGCSPKNKFVGEYSGTSGSFLKLNDDGTCIYSEDDSTGTGTGTWYIEDDTIYISVSNIGYTIYTDISNFDGGLLIKSDSSSWNDEYFKKVS